MLTTGSWSAEARLLDYDGLDAVFGRLEMSGLVAARQEPTDGFQRPRPGVTYTQDVAQL